jgi:hypothetical protein
MKMSHKPVLALFNRWKSKGPIVCGIGLISFTAGSFITAHLTHLNQVRADSNRVFELRVYRAVQGKASALESRFRDASKLLAKHDLKAVGYWVPNEDPAWENTFVYILTHASRDEAKKNWAAFHADPAFQEFVKSEQANQLIENVDGTYMRPTDFSPIR